VDPIQFSAFADELEKISFSFSPVLAPLQKLTGLSSVSTGKNVASKGFQDFLKNKAGQEAAASTRRFENMNKPVRQVLAPSRRATGAAVPLSL
jgi:hypothetical protein